MKKRISKVALFGATLCLLMNTLVKAQVGYINTICGTGIAGYNGDNIPAISAEVNCVEGLCLDDTGNVIFTDGYNNRVRKISITTGIITTLAGTTDTGSTGDGGPAINAKLNIPQAVFTDDNNNIYIADAANNKIRKINAATGIINTIAGTGVAGGGGDGGLAINAQLNIPSGLYVDKYRNVFIADYSNNKIRKINASTGIITTIAGTGGYGYSGDNGLAVNAEFYGCVQVFVDSFENIYITDQYNNVIRKINGTTNIITTIAGNGFGAGSGFGGYAGNGGLAIDAELNQPCGIYVDKHGNVYFCDWRNGAIRYIDSTTGIITTISGTGTQGYGGDGGPALSAQLVPADVFLDRAGNILIADYSNNRIRKITETTGIPTSPTGSEVVVYPNPVQDIVQIKGLNTTATYKLCNMIGSTIMQGTLTNNSIDVSKLSSGVYVLTLTPQHTPDPSQEGNVVVRRIIKQ